MKKMLMLGVLAAMAFASPAMAKQCVWNKGGFVLRVDWFHSNDVEISPGSGANAQDKYDLVNQPVQSDTITTAQGRCISKGDEQFVAIYSICGLSNGVTHDITQPADWPDDQKISCPVWTRDTPSTANYTDVWGTVFSPQKGPGGPVQ